MIIGHTFAAHIANMILGDDTWLCLKNHSQPSSKPIVLSYGSFQCLQKHIKSVEAFPIYELELSSYRQWGTLRTKTDKILGYSIESNKLHEKLSSYHQPKVVTAPVLKHYIENANTIVFADGKTSLGHKLDCQVNTGKPSMSIVIPTTLKQPCLKAMQRYTPWGIFAWIPQSEQHGTCVVTTHSTTHIDPAIIEKVWHHRLYIDHLGPTSSHQITPHLSRLNNNQNHYLLGTSGLATAPILARGLNVVFEQCYAILKSDRELFDRLAKNAYDNTRYLHQCADIKFARGLSLHFLQPIIQSSLTKWGSQVSLRGAIA